MHGPRDTFQKMESAPLKSCSWDFWALLKLLLVAFEITSRKGRLCFHGAQTHVHEESYQWSRQPRQPVLIYKPTQNIQLSPQTQGPGEEEDSHELLLGVGHLIALLMVPGEPIPV